MGGDGTDVCKEYGASLGEDSDSDLALTEAGGLVLGVEEVAVFRTADTGAGDGDNPGGLVAAGSFCADIKATWLCMVS